MLLADVIFPAPSAAYVASLFFPLAGVLALAAELAVFFSFQRGVTSWLRILGAVMGVNLMSWIVGIAFSFVLPSGIVPRLAYDNHGPIYVADLGPRWGTLAIVSFFWACLLSFGLEYAALRAMRRSLPFRNLALCVGLANVASYGVIAAVVAVHLHFGLF